MEAFLKKEAKTSRLSTPTTHDIGHPARSRPLKKPGLKPGTDIKIVSVDAPRLRGALSKPWVAGKFERHHRVQTPLLAPAVSTKSP